MAQYFDSPIATLSMGMKQKVALIASLLHHPSILLLDEPLNGLDAKSSRIIKDLVSMHTQKGGAVVFSTHIMEQAEQICDYVVLIDKGKKVVDGPLAQVRASGGQAVQLDYDGDGAGLQDLPGIRRINDAGKQAELLLEKGADPQQVLAALIDRVQIRRFDLRQPSLHEIFIRAVGGGG